MKLQHLGLLKQNTEDWPLEKDWITETPVSIPLFPDVKVPFMVDHSDYGGIYNQKQTDNAIQNLFEYSESLKKEIEQTTYTQWIDFNNAVGYLETLKVYKSANDAPKWMTSAIKQMEPLIHLTSQEKIWEHIFLYEVVITKDRYLNDKDIYVKLLMNCRWAEEHGLQIILKNGNKLVRVSEIDGNLFD
ncbi:hypothetical protein GCM10022393_42320 [Aquimarina addita]|uniref:DUF6985 domain-containing protein n=1 Tax=Aquimarina addita TaxID=870485 RepID=A0ABP6UVT2_9FLAO